MTRRQHSTVGWRHGRWRLAAGFIVAAALLLALAGAPAFAGETPSQIVHEYLTAYARNENKKLREMLPGNEADLFGPYPFVSKPTLKRAKVDENQALVEFAGNVGDKNFPGEGGVLFMRRDGVWLVRQVLFYEKIPALFGLPKSSPTAQDRKAEPAVMALAERFLNAWQRNDTADMLSRWHRWMDRESDPIQGLSISQYDYSATTTRWGEPFARYKTKLTYKWGILSYSMTFNGGFIMVRDRNGWKVRGNVMVLYF